MMATMSVDQHEECLQKCAEKARCKAVNYFHPFAYQKKAFCELLSETQRDNPRLMRPFRMATYFENIQCREVDVADDLVDIVHSESHFLDIPMVLLSNGLHNEALFLTNARYTQHISNHRCGLFLVPILC